MDGGVGGRGPRIFYFVLECNIFDATGMFVQEDKMTMLYEVREGACLESFGIHVAAMAGFPRAVIREAKRKAATLENFEEAMERIGDAGLSKKRKASDDAGKVEGSAGRGGSSDKPKSTKLHRLVEMFKVRRGARGRAGGGQLFFFPPRFFSFSHFV